VVRARPHDGDEVSSRGIDSKTGISKNCGKVEANLSV
jgi:hypothetical protein